VNAFKEAAKKPDDEGKKRKGNFQENFAFDDDLFDEIEGAAESNDEFNLDE
jgi:hypothetical protein